MQDDEIKRILVCGSRYWMGRDSYDAIVRELKRFPNAELVIHGGCGGADTQAGRAATELGIPVAVYPANWKKHGKAAGPIRNALMLAEGRPDIVLAFHEDIGLGRGTADMVAKAKAADVEVRVFHK